MVVGPLFYILLKFFVVCMGILGVVYGMTNLLSKRNISVRDKINFKKLFASFFSVISQVLRSRVKEEKEEGEEFDPLEKWPVLNFYEGGDPLVKNFDGDIEPVNEVDDLEIESFSVKALFIGMVNENTAVVYNPTEKELGNVESLNEIDLRGNPKKVYEESIEIIMSKLVNPAAELRKRELDGARSLCRLENSSFDEFRKTKREEKLKLESADASPCDKIDKSRKKIKSNNLISESVG